MKTIKKLLIIGFGIGSFLFLLLITTNHFWPEFYAPPINPVFTDYTIGKSMMPTLPETETKIMVDSSKTPRVGDVVDFLCYTEKCLNGDSIYSNGRIKRLAQIDERGCYYFLGDNPEHSWDSRNYGYLCPPNDVKILGVVIQ